MSEHAPSGRAATGRSDALGVADRLFRSIEAGQVDDVREIYAPDAVIWHNHDGVEQGCDENLRTLEWVTRNITGLRYERVRRSATDDGFVQQHVLRGTNPAGVEVEMPACIVATVVDGRITRLEEYLDSRHVEAFTRR